MAGPKKKDTNMIRSEENLREAANILEWIETGVGPTNPIVTFNRGRILLTSNIHPRAETEVVLFDGVEGFGGAWEDASAEDVLAFIEDTTEPFYVEGSADLQVQKRNNGMDEYAVSVSGAEVTVNGVYMAWDDYHAIIEAIHDQVGIGTVESSDTDAWIVLSSNELDKYPTSINFSATKHIEGGLVETCFKLEE